MAFLLPDHYSPSADAAVNGKPSEQLCFRGVGSGVSKMHQDSEIAKDSVHGPLLSFYDCLLCLLSSQIQVQGNRHKISNHLLTPSVA